MNTAGQGLVSVIIPFLNRSEWLIEALDSVVSQSYPNWEVILVDDGSDLIHSDISVNYSRQYPEKIRYMDHAGHINRGVTISRNVGAAASKGGFIAFLDADDKWLPDKLSAQIALFERFPAAQMICEDSWFWYSWANIFATDTITPVGAKPGILYPPISLSKYLYPLGEGAPPCPSGLMIRKAAFQRVGGFEPAFSGIYQLYEDQALLAKVYLNEPVFVSGVANNLYRKRNNSMSSGVDDITLYTTVRTFFLDWLQEYLAAKKIDDPIIARLINAARENIKDMA